MFTDDNGFFHGEHRVSNGKVLIYEPSIRVLLILRGPACPARPAAVSNVDLAPMILCSPERAPAAGRPLRRCRWPRTVAWNMGAS